MTAYDLAVELLRERMGFRFDRAMGRRLERLLPAGASARGLSPEAYVARAERDEDVFQDLLDRVAVPETSFFRDEAQLRGFAARILPGLYEPLRVWCAACSTGQEAYSIAMLLAESGVRDWELIATDVVTPGLESTIAASYEERELRGLQRWRRERWLHREDAEYVVDSSLRRHVTVLRHNLVAEDPPFVQGTCQVIFCRNVLIYFDPPRQAGFLARVHEWLPEGGHLLVGAAESLSHLPTDLVAVDLGGAYAYSKLDQPPARPPARAPAPAALRPPPPLPPRPAPASLAPLPDVETLVAAGDAAAARGDFADAVRAYRQAAYLEPEAPLPHALLGLALEHAGDAAGARRAFRAGWTALERAGAASVEPELEGYRAEELARLLIEKLAAPA